MIGAYIGVILLISSIIADEGDDKLYPLDPLDPLEEDFHYDPLFQLANMKSGSDYQEKNASQSHSNNKKEPDYIRWSPSLSSLPNNLKHPQIVKEMKELQKIFSEEAKDQGVYHSRENLTKYQSII